jgi:large subunit ribosomal protein L24
MNKKKTSYHSHIKAGDTIKVIAGENKGTIGKIEAIFLKKSIVFVEGILPRIKYGKRTPNTEAVKVELQIPIHISNVMLWDSKAKLASRIGYKIIDSKKYRYFKKSGNVV